jgi:fatty acid desaturase
VTGATLKRTVLAADAGATAHAVPESHARAAVELPTLILILAVYGGWLGMTLSWARWPMLLVVPAVALLVTLHASLQHEILHGHPTRWTAVNRLLGIIPLSLWLPYDRYRQTHRLHHRDAYLTDPLDDPESFYWAPEDWAKAGALMREFMRVEHTLAGRVTLGAVWRILRFLGLELGCLARNEPGLRRIWLEHLIWCIPVVLWVSWVCGIPLWLYVVAMIVPANGIQLIRSFAEHRARPGCRERTAIVEKSWILGPLFLFNNLHSLHHDVPALPWYQYISRYRRERERLIAENGGLVYNSYFDIARRFLWRPHDSRPHPLGRVSADGTGGR